MLHGVGDISIIKDKLINEIEDAEFTLLPGNIYLIPNAGSHREGIGVQPDGIITSTSTFALIEAKRIKESSFQAEQLAREFAIVTREAKERLPLLIFIIDKNPPIRISGSGRKSIKDAIMYNLEVVLNKSKNHPYSIEQLERMIDYSVTWSEIKDVIDKQSETFICESSSTRACMLGIIAKANLRIQSLLPWSLINQG